MKKNVKCPHCGHLSSFTPENPYRPFCSERCKLIDLGNWASEKNRLPGEPVDKQELPESDNDD